MAHGRAAEGGEARAPWAVGRQSKDGATGGGVRFRTFAAARAAEPFSDERRGAIDRAAVHAPARRALSRG